MSDLHGLTTTVGLPSADDVDQIIGLLRNGVTDSARSDAANRLVSLAGREPHPAARAAILEHAAGLVINDDRERAALLLRESFRYDPTSAVGARLIELSDADASLGRFGRMADVVDAVAALGPPESSDHAWLEAARRQVELGLGSRSIAALARVSDRADADLIAAADEIRAIATSQQEDRQEALAAHREALAADDSAAVAEALAGYAELLVVGDAPAADVTAVLADAAEAGVDPERVAALWAEGARAARQPEQLARALAASLSTDQPPHIRLRTADELANLPNIDRIAPKALVVALDALSEALPDDLALRARMFATRALLGEADAEPMLEQLRGEAVRSRDRAAEAAAAIGLARIANTQGDNERVDRMLRRVRTLEPDNQEALAHFEARYRAAGEFERLSVLLGQRLSLAEGANAIAIACEIARLAAGPLNSPERAADAWHRVLALAPDHDEALHHLAAHERESGDVVLLADLLDRRATNAEGRGDTVGAVTALDELVALHSEGGDLPDSLVRLSVLKRIAAIAPQRGDIVDLVAESLRAARRFDELAALLERRIDAVDAGAGAVAVANAVFDLPAGRAPHSLILRALSVVEHDEDADAATLCRAAQALAAGATEDEEIGARVVALWLRARAATEGAESVELLATAANTAADVGMTDAAMSLFEALLHADASRDRDRLRLGLMRSIAGDNAGAIVVLAAGVAGVDWANADDAGNAIRGDMLEALVRARIAAGDQGDGFERDLVALRQVRPSSSIASEAALLVAIAAGDVEGSATAATALGLDRAALIAKLVEDAGALSPEAATSQLTLAAQLEDDPARKAALAGLALASAATGTDAALIAAAAERAADWANAAGDTQAALIALAMLVEATEGDAHRAALVRRLDAASAAMAYDQGFSGAIELLALELDADLGIEGAVAAVASTARRIIEFAVAMGDAEAGIQLVADYAAARIEGDARPIGHALVAVAAEAALREGVGREGAGLALTQWLGDGTADAPAGDTADWTMAERLASESNDWSAAVDALQAQAAFAAGDVATDLLIRAAGLAEGAAKDFPRAAHLWTLALNARPSSLTAWTGRLSSLRSAGDLDALAAAIDAMLAAPIADLELVCRAFLDRLDLPGGDDGATIIANAALPMALLAAAASLPPEGEAVLAVIAGRLDIAEEAAAAAPLVISVARAHARYDELARALEAMPPAADVDQRIAQLQDLATLADNRLADGERACSALRSAVLLRPSDEALWSQLEALAARRGLTADVSALVDVLAGLADGEADAVAARDDANLSPLLRRSARLAHGAGRLDDAAAAYEKLARLTPGDPAPLDALAELWREARDADALVHVLERRARVTTEPEARAIAWIELVEVHRNERGDGRAALAALATATADLPDSELLWASRIDALAAEGDEPALVEALNARFDGLSAEAPAILRAEILSQRGLARRGLTPALAVTDLADALQLDLTNDAAAIAAAELIGSASVETLLALADVFDARGDYTALAAALAAAVVAVVDPVARAATLQRLAAVCSDQLGDPAGAFAALAQALALNAGDRGMCDALVAIAAVAGGPGARNVAGAIMDAAAAAEPDDKRRLHASALALVDASGDEAACTALRGRIVQDGGDDGAFESWIAGLSAAERWPDVVAAWLARGETGGERGRKARKQAAAIVEAEVGDSGAAHDLWLSLAIDDVTDAEAIDETLRLADLGDTPADTEALLAEAVRGLGAGVGLALGVRLAERMAARGDNDIALAQLDALIADAADSQEAFVLRGALLENAGDDARLRAHLEHGVAHASDDDARRSRTLVLADHLVGAGAADAAFAVLCGEIERTDDEGRRADFVAIATAIAADADLHLDAAALVAAEAARSPVGTRGARLLAAAALATAGGDHAGAKQWAREALNEGDQGAPSALMAEAAAILVTIAGDELPDSDDQSAIVTALAAHQANEASTLLDRLAQGSDDATKIGWLERGAALATDKTGALRALALADLGNAERWSLLEEAYGTARRDEWLEALLAGVESCEEPVIKAQILERAATAAQAQQEVETAAAWLTLAYALAPRPDLRDRLLALLRAHDQPAMLVEALVEAATDAESATLTPAARNELLTEALTAARACGDAELTLRALDALGANGDESEDAQVERLTLGQSTGQPGANDAVSGAFDQADVGLASRLLPAQMAALMAKGDVAGAGEAYRKVRGDSAVAGDDVLLADILDQVHALPPALATALLRLGVDSVDAQAAPGRWASLRLQLVALEEDDDDVVAGLDALIAHAAGPLADPDLLLEWSTRALYRRSSERARADALLLLAKDDSAWAVVVPSLAAALCQAVAGEVQGDTRRFCALIAAVGADHDVIDAIAARADEAEFALSAVDSLCGALRAAGAIESAQSLERLAISAGGEGDGVRVAGALTAAAEDDPSRLHDALEAVMAVADQPEAGALFASLADAARRADRLDAWLDAVEVALGRDDVGLDEARTLAAIAAGVVVEDLGDPGRAADLWTHIWDRDSTDLDARDAVLALRRDAEAPSRLAADLDRAVMQGGDDLGPLRLELAVLLVGVIGRPRSALVHLRAQLDLDSSDEATSAMLEQLADQPALARDALDTLVRAYRGRDDSRGLADALERRVRLRGDRGSAEDLRELAALYAGALKRPAEAQKAAKRAAAVARDTASADVLLGAALSSEDPGQIVEAAKTALAMGLSIETQLDVARRALAWLDANETGQTDREALLRSIIENEPADSSAWAALDGLLDEAGRWPELVALRQQRLIHVVDPSEHIAHLNELAALAAATGNIDAAMHAYKALGGLIDSDPTPFEALSELLANTPHHRERAEALEAWASRVSGADRVRALCEAARLYVSPLKQRENAGRIYAEAFAVDGSTDEAFVYLEKVASDRPRELAALFRRRAAAMEPGPSRVVVLRKLAGVCADVGDHAGARAALAQAYEDAPTNDTLAIELLEAAEVAGDWTGFRTVAARRLEGQLPRHERVMLTRKVARMAVDHDDEADKWLDTLEALVPGDREVTSLRGLLAAASDDPEVAASGLELVVRDADDPVRKVRLLGRLAKIYCERLDQPSRAISALQRLLRIDERRFDAHAALCDLYTERQSAEALAEALRHWYEALDVESPDRVVVGLRLGAILVEQGRDEEARTPLEAAFAADPHSAEVLETMALYRMRTGNFAEAAELQLRVVERLRRTGQRDAVPAAAGRAAALLERVGRQEDARTYYRSALAGMPNDVDHLLGLGRVSLALGDVERALVELDKVARMPDGQADPAQRAEAQVGLGHCWLRQKKKAQARTAFNRALELRPGMREAVDGIALT